MAYLDIGNAASQQTSTGTSSLTIASGDMPATAADGDRLFLVAGRVALQPDSGYSFAWDTISGWTQVGTVTSSDDQGADTLYCYLSVWQRVRSGSGGVTVSWTGSNSTSSLRNGDMAVVVAYRPDDTYSELGVASRTGSSLAGQTPTSSWSFTVDETGDVLAVGAFCPNDVIEGSTLNGFTSAFIGDAGSGATTALAIAYDDSVTAGSANGPTYQISAESEEDGILLWSQMAIGLADAGWSPEPGNPVVPGDWGIAMVG
jgi:hypothetical protein